MTTKLKSHNFIDTLTFELTDIPSSFLNAVVKDEEGKICNQLQTEISPGTQTLAWPGFNHLPYGLYTLELSVAKEKRIINLVKRV